MRPNNQASRFRMCRSSAFIVVLAMTLGATDGAQAKPGAAPAASTLKVVQTTPSAAGPLGPEDSVEASLDYALAREDQGGELRLYARLWSTVPPQDQLLPVEVLSESPLSVPSGSARVVLRLAQVYEDTEVAHPVRLRFVLNRLGPDETSQVITQSELLTFETGLTKTAWKDPAWLQARLEAGEPIPFAKDLGMTAPKKIKGKVPTFKPSPGGRVGIYKLTIGIDGLVSAVETLLSVDEAIDNKAARSLGRWKFRPATYQGGPIPVIYTMTVRFQ